jgi:hypothetical protein
MTDIGQIMAECDCQHSACWDRKYCMAAKVDSLTAKLATCEKYRDAYDKMGRIGTEAYRDLEAKLAKAVEALREWDDLIKHQYSGSREAMSDMTYAAKHTAALLAEIEGGKT